LSFPLKLIGTGFLFFIRKPTTNEALAYFDAVDGDVIKSQNLFAIYDPIIDGTEH
jgi:hypothetical protein